MNDPKDATSFWIDKEVAEEQLLRQIAYYKARLMDIQKAPRHSRHRQGWSTANERLQECREKLAKLRRARGGTRH